MKKAGLAILVILLLAVGCENSDSALTIKKSAAPVNALIPQSRTDSSPRLAYQAISSNYVPLKTRIKNGEMVSGTFCTISHGPDVFQYMKAKGLDFVILDTEHAPYDLMETRSIIAACRAVGMAPLVRISEPGHLESLMLDLGAEGIIIPLTETREQAEKLVEYGRYLPQGSRGIASVNGHNDMAGAKNLGDFIKERNQDVLLFVMIETQKGIDNMDKIFSTPGIDGCIVGTGDLSMNLGYPGQPDIEQVAAVSEKIIEKCQEKGIIGTLPIRKPSDAARWINKDVNMLIFGSDTSLVAEGIANFLSAAKQAKKH